MPPQTRILSYAYCPVHTIIFAPYGHLSYESTIGAWFIDEGDGSSKVDEGRSVIE